MMSSLDEDGFDDEEDGKKVKKKKKRLERLIRRRLIERLFLRVKPHPQNNTTQKKKSFKNDVDENLLQHNFGFPLDGRAKKSAKKKKKKKKKKQKKRRPLRIKRVTTCHHDTAVGHAVVFECTKV